MRVKMNRNTISRKVFMRHESSEFSGMFKICEEHPFP
jgi:hypothetical protein